MPSKVFVPINTPREHFWSTKIFKSKLQCCQCQKGNILVNSWGKLEGTVLESSSFSSSPAHDNVFQDMLSVARLFISQKPNSGLLHKISRFLNCWKLIKILKLAWLTKKPCVGWECWYTTLDAALVKSESSPHTQRASQGRHKEGQTPQTDKWQF